MSWFCLGTHSTKLGLGKECFGLTEKNSDFQLSDTTLLNKAVICLKLEKLRIQTGIKLCMWCYSLMLCFLVYVVYTQPFGVNYAKT